MPLSLSERVAKYRLSSRHNGIVFTFKDYSPDLLEPLNALVMSENFVNIKDCRILLTPCFISFIFEDIVYDSTFLLAFILSSFLKNEIRKTSFFLVPGFDKDNFFIRGKNYCKRRYEEKEYEKSLPVIYQQGLMLQKKEGNIVVCDDRINSSLSKGDSI